jgi:phage tail-like protein
VARWGAALGGLGLAVVLAVTSTLFVVAPAPADAQADAITAARFSITIDGVEIAAFNELEGINAEIAATEYLEASDTGVRTSKLPGLPKPPTVTLKRGMTGGMELWAWHEAVRKGNMAAARKSASLVMFNAENKPVARYWLENAWPSKLEIGGLKAGSSMAMTETVTLVCEYIQRVAP